MCGILSSDPVVSSPSRSSDDILLTEHLPYEGSAYSLRSPLVQPSSALPSLEKRENRGRRNPSSLSPHHAKTRSSLTPRPKGNSKTRSTKPQDSASPSFLEPKCDKRSKSREKNIYSVSTERKHNDPSKTKDESHNSCRSKVNQPHHSQNSMRRKKSRKQQPSYTISHKPSNQSGQGALASGEEKCSKSLLQREEKNNSSKRVGRDGSRGRQRTKKRESINRRKAETNGQEEVVEAGTVPKEEVKEKKKLLQDTVKAHNTSKLRVKRSRSQHKHKEVDKLQQLQSGLQGEERDIEVYDLVIQNRDQNEFEEQLIIIDAPVQHDPWTVPSFARILTRDEVLRDLYG